MRIIAKFLCLVIIFGIIAVLQIMFFRSSKTKGGAGVTNPLQNPASTRDAEIDEVITDLSEMGALAGDYLRLEGEDRVLFIYDPHHRNAASGVCFGDYASQPLSLWKGRVIQVINLSVPQTPEYNEALDNFRDQLQELKAQKKQ